MKESTLLEMKNKIEAQNRVLQFLMTEVTHLRELGVGTLEAVKLMPGYEQAIEDLKNNMIKKQEKQNGVIEQDSK